MLFINSHTTTCNMDTPPPDNPYYDYEILNLSPIEPTRHKLHKEAMQFYFYAFPDAPIFGETFDGVYKLGQGFMNMPAVLADCIGTFLLTNIPSDTSHWDCLCCFSTFIMTAIYYQ